LPYPQPDRLVEVRGAGADEQERAVSAPDFLDLRREAAPVTAAAAYREDVFDLTSGAGDPERIDGVQVTPDYFAIFGVRASLGRTLEGAEPGQRLVRSWEGRSHFRTRTLGRPARAQFSTRCESKVCRR
nr:hypothetical protein [Gemmatimonadota bacterium]